MVMTLQPPANPQDPAAPGLSAIATTTLSLLYGTVEAQVQQSSIGGVVTYVTLINHTSADEIDYEWIGNERTTVWTNFFYRGRRERDATTKDEIWSSKVPVTSDTRDNVHTYKIDWTPDYIQWSIDGTVTRTQFKNETFEAAGTGDGLAYDHYHYPDTPMTVNFGIWNYQGPLWANGPIDWTKQTTPLNASFLSLKVTCYNGPAPVTNDPVVVPAASDVYVSSKMIQKAPATTAPVPTTVLGSAVTAGAAPTVSASSGGASTVSVGLTALPPKTSATRGLVLGFFASILALLFA
ncbi:concanavalin A-like lectin/glucanase domain-containing protein [Chytriomyces sp. MP71]|nr:concanavalin A-like lectin/glucanase domain-containing protein [Chytriomyces sp. MP71]